MVGPQSNVGMIYPLTRQRKQGNKHKGFSLDERLVDVLLFVEATLDPLQQLVVTESSRMVRGEEGASECPLFSTSASRRLPIRTSNVERKHTVGTLPNAQLLHSYWPKQFKNDDTERKTRIHFLPSFEI